MSATDPDRFAVFILTHGRPDNVITYNTLRRQGYTGDIYIIIDNEDKTGDQYRKLYGDKVIIFDKAAIAATFDEGDNFADRRAVIYARNASFEIARRLGIKYFLQLDDDYSEFKYRIDDTEQHPFDHYTVRRHLDAVFAAMLEFYIATPAKSIATLQGGDFFGGGENFGQHKRKCMNTFFCSTDRPFHFVGRINEDVNTYTTNQRRGDLFMSIPFIQMDQLQTQSNAGGMTDLYLDSGTYIKSFYTIMYAPSCARIGTMGRTHRRLHHIIDWEHTAPQIIAERHRRSPRQAEEAAA